jgi:hypothetical protein
LRKKKIRRRIIIREENKAERRNEYEDTGYVRRRNMRKMSQFTSPQ